MRPWADIESAADVAKIRVPLWENNRLLCIAIERYENLCSFIRHNIPGDKVEAYIDKIDFNFENWGIVSEGKKVVLQAVLGFLDIGPYLSGHTDYFMKLSYDSDYAEAMVDKCYEIGDSYFEFRKKFSRAPSGFEKGISMGADYTCILSPDMFDKYCLKHDTMQVEKFGNIPSNFHSCGASSHLYKNLANYVNKDKIVLMQTRGVVDKTNILRESLPDTFLDITILQPQFDFAYAKQDEIQNLVEDYAKAAGYKNLGLKVAIHQNSDNLLKNMEVFCKTVDEINTNYNQCT